ncbi:hypothetical protein QQS21_011985 [Conoideocrella luteorostrata]|uniref:Major facilitator superfamily (MFS) profile domain-containing protein n=1 Tax=Conoideocrella luteorostrata TaxID=1105319 RepID=A0AAJ0CD46_9HYPO|nr:hypothetical protein QQS21_011985 [Conoideocrella luteorostrata]
MIELLKRGKQTQFGINVCCDIAFVLYGWEQGVFGPILENENWLDLFNHPSDSQTGIIVSCYNLGCLLGCVLVFLLSEMLGRRRTLWLGVGSITVGTALQISSYTLPHLIVGRIITGVATGIKTSTVPAWQSELCPPVSRGRLISSDVMFVGIGTVLSYWFNFGMSYVDGPISWRFPISMQIVFTIINSPFIVSEKTIILQALELEKSAGDPNKSFFSVFKKDQLQTRYRIFLAWCIQFMNQASGIVLVVYYLPTILKENIGLPHRTALIVPGFAICMFVLGGIWPATRLDHMGRRKTMMWGSSALSTCMLFIAALLSQADGGATSRGTTFASASVAFFFLYLLAFGASVNCVPWVFVPEILPLQARARGTAIGVSSNWLWNFTVAMISPVVLNRL